jgi:hypothetical protein
MTYKPWPRTQSIVRIVGNVLHDPIFLQNFSVASGKARWCILREIRLPLLDIRRTKNMAKAFETYLFFCWPCIVIYPYNRTNRMNHLLSIYFNNFEQAYCSSSRCTTLYIQQFVYVMRLCPIPILPTASQQKHMTGTNCCIYRIVPTDDEQ